MSEAGSTAPTARRRVNWLVVALVASLAVNLMVVGAAAARWYVGFGPDRMSRMTQSQLIPRTFFRDLDRDRRLELLAVFRAHDQEIREGRKAVKAEVSALADALVAEPYDSARVGAAVAAFTRKSEALFVTGGDAALGLIGKLTPAERRQLADHLRLRQERGRGGAAAKPTQSP